MKQVILQKGRERLVGWIEDRGAKLGAMVEVLADGAFWKVVEVFGFEMDQKTLREHQKMHRNSLKSIQPMG